MASPRGHRRVIEEKNRLKGKLSEKSMSFQGYISGSTSELYRMPRTAPDLFSGKGSIAGSPMEFQVKPKLTKLLLNVTIQRSLGPLQVLISPESTVHDLIAAVVRQYSKEGRRPALYSTDFSRYDLHYSQFSLASLDREEKVMALGTRNFFLCPKKLGAETSTCSDLTASSSRCKKEADYTDIIDLPWPNFML
ncbi:putative histone deacetylase HDT1-like [Capsicum annuum]|nr:putative histone deacetylase HDT1-like [Capsicum annuum]KAF3683715.1 putative histone deacetylase HDT1-like [Capsicum annuum]